MNNSFNSHMFGAAGGPASAIVDAMDQLRKSFEQHAGPSRMARGDVRAAVLALLAIEPMHGYQIMHEIEERSGGAWKPSAGSVYPTLQQLSDEGLITAEELNGRKTYSLTDTGREAADSADAPAPWEAKGARNGSRHAALTKAGIDLASATAQVARTGTPEQAQQAVAILDDARRKLYSILAEG
ncbi:Transcriptional regulator PadR-like family protein [Paramicrobacterium humi]|uniref:Transcriptional regulator PadR-like family protein n=1 Tax=Paramicrobacterium humi TaxID=640635 RepID=A0A1H4K1M7_9MICO|nr:PadR family transcriptional regulator [Microbacterium humi]SEB52459.1 Transcriptional regulator PadR-like family protein [Microbacterium humi]